MKFILAIVSLSLMVVAISAVPNITEIEQLVANGTLNNPLLLGELLFQLLLSFVVPGTEYSSNFAGWRFENNTVHTEDTYSATTPPGSAPISESDQTFLKNFAYAIAGPIAKSLVDQQLQ